MAKRQLSEAGSRACAESGNRNLQAWLQRRRDGADLEPSQIEAEVAALRERLEAQASTAIPDSVRDALIASAATQLLKVRLIERQLLRVAHLSARARLGGEDLAPLTSNLIRTLRALGCIGAESDDDKADPMAAIRQVAERIVAERKSVQRESNETSAG